MCPQEHQPWAGDVLPGATHCREPGLPALPHLSLFSQPGLYLPFMNVFIYKPFPGWKKPFALQREIPFSW